MSDHISVNLIPAYKPLICRTRPTTRTVQVWTEEVSSALQDCFECTDWEVFKEGTDLDGYTSSVLSYLKFCTDAVLPTKTIKVFPNQKPWLDSTVKPLLKACDTAYRCTIERILTGCITAWYSSCTALNRKALQRVVKAAQHITRTELPSMEDLYTQRCKEEGHQDYQGPQSPSYKLFCLLPSGRRFRSIRARTTRLREASYRRP
ncbi:hypothetical protein L3Q82_005834 [Scortum barcoo]|uniref:Uncharacterized protein n=1 Tax=Scortum barcoo TaxID=214431 RepID=A0ACB8V6S7_9TELE|nr:hypothetical protein L3Q82_005834 [Scortum barcoo]